MASFTIVPRSFLDSGRLLGMCVECEDFGGFGDGAGFEDRCRWWWWCLDLDLEVRTNIINEI